MTLDEYFNETRAAMRDVVVELRKRYSQLPPVPALWLRPSRVEPGATYLYMPCGVREITEDPPLRRAVVRAIYRAPLLVEWYMYNGRFRPYLRLSGLAHVPFMARPGRAGPSDPLLEAPLVAAKGVPDDATLEDPPPVPMRDRQVRALACDLVRGLMTEIAP